MALTCGRAVRFVKSILVPATSVLLFTLLLTWVFILYQPNHGPGELQRVGWQAWDSVSSPNSTSSGASPSTPIDENNDAIDWWNVSTEGTKQDPSSFPLDAWLPLLPHVNGLTEITIEKCLLPWSMSSYCYPHSTPEQDTLRGQWVRVERDLNYNSGLWSLFVYYRRSRRLDVQLVDDIVLLPKNEEPTRQGNWNKVLLSIRDGIPRTPPLFLWYRLGKTMANLLEDEKKELITELDILFGDNRPWYGFEKLEPATTIGEEGRVESAWLTLRRGIKVPPRAPPLHFSHNGTFRILQVADLHYSVSQGVCRDVSFSPCTHSDNLTNTLLGHVIDEERPDLIIFTGDQLNGQGTSWDPRSVLAKFANAVTDRGIPWAAIFGNHDSEIGLSREDQMTLMRGMPYSLVEPGPKEIHGVGNFVLKVHSADPSKTHLLTLYFLDSGSYSKGFWDWFGFFHATDYDYIRKDQIEWFLKQSASVKPIERPFQPDGARDFDHVWRRQSVSQVTPTRKLAKPNAITFFHIPLPESYYAPDTDRESGLPLDYGLHDLEMPGNAKGSDGFFDNAILQAFETEHNTGNNMKEIKVIANGHCHVTENCRRIKGVWLCFGGGGSFSGYSKIGFDRRFRIYDISDYGETISTYMRTEHDEVLNRVTLVGRGAPLP